MDEGQFTLAQLELMCKQLYETSDGPVRIAAEKALVGFVDSSDCLSTCQMLLDRGDSPYSQLLAASTLTKLISKPSTSLPLEQRLHIRNYILNYLASRSNLSSFVLPALVQLFSRVTKLGWFDTSKTEFVFRNVTQDVGKFLQSPETVHNMIGVQLLSQLVCEMNQVSEAEASRSLTKHRKIASSFRDTQLFEIFQLACNLLKLACSSLKSGELSSDQSRLLTHTLRLAHNCLTFDFIGTSTDESADDLCTVQIPTSWRAAFLDVQTLQLFFDLYRDLPASIAPMAISCLVQIASVRRSLFNNAERAKFLNHLAAGVKGVLEQPQGLSDSSNYHEFCRLLARLKSNYQLGELVKVDNYATIIRLIADFTVTSLRMWQFAPNSVHYLLNLWQRMVASVPYVKSSEPHLLEQYTPDVTEAYITSRLESVLVVIRDNLEDPLEDQGMLQQQLEQLSVIGRCDYEKTCTLVIRLFDEAAARYREYVLNGNFGMELAVEEGRLSWLVYVIGSVIGGRISFASTDDHDTMDGELVCRVLQLMALTDANLHQHGYDKLELALVNFFDQFRKMYVGDQVQKTSKVYRRLSEVLGLSDEPMVLSVIIGKIITNLKCWGNREMIISRTLQLLSDLSVGYSSVRKLVKLEAVQFVLVNHTSEHFPFLGVNSGTTQMGDLRYRTTFYTAMGRLLMVDLGEDEERFEQFMMPLTRSFDLLKKSLSLDDASLVRNIAAKRAVIGLARDLRGIAFAFNTKTSYMMLFDWIYPDNLPVFVRAIQLWYADPCLTTPVLKFLAELAQNRSQRLQFDVSSPNGILLFREISRVVTTYGAAIQTVDVPKEDIYLCKLKGTSICFSMLKAILCGNYVNFGVFRLYGDDALDDALQMFVKLLLSISQSDLLAFPKLSQTYYSLLDCLAADHMDFIASLKADVFIYILSTISEGLTALDTMVCAGCCATLDNIVTYLFKRMNAKSRKRNDDFTDPLVSIIRVQPDVLHQILSTVLNIIMFEDCRNQWSMSRPLLSLILLNEDYFHELRDSIIGNQSPDKQQSMVRCFEKLMDGIERSLLVKNRDRFTQNLSVFRRDVNDSMKVFSSQGTSDMIN